MPTSLTGLRREQPDTCWPAASACTPLACRAHLVENGVTTRHHVGVPITRAFRVLIAASLGVVLVTVGVITFVATEPSSFGWFAYEPLPTGGHTPFVLSRGQALGLATGAIGALLLSGLLGYSLGQRHVAARGDI